MSQQSPKLRSLDDLDRIVCADLHVQESLHDLMPYIDEDKYLASKRILQDIIGDTERDLQGNIMSAVYSSSIPLADAKSSNYGDKKISTAEVANEYLGDFDISHAICDPNLNLKINTVENDRIAVAIANAYNSWLLDNFLDRDNGLKGNILVAPQQPEKAAEEIDLRAKEKDMVGIQLPVMGLLPPTGHPTLNPIYETAEKHDLPIVMHGSSSSSMHMFPTIRRWCEVNNESHIVMHPFVQMWSLTSLLSQGVPERYPGLNFVFQEAGIGWIPYLKWRWDDHYLDRPEQHPYLEKLPSEYFKDQFYFSTQPLGHTAENNEHMAWAIEMAGPDSIMYSSDLPHLDWDPPGDLFKIINSHFDEKTVRGIMGETAADLFGL